MIDVGSYGRNSDGSIFAESVLGKQLDEGNFPHPSFKLKSPNGVSPTLPHVIVGDEAFPLKEYLMRPYPRPQISDDETKQVFN